MSTLSYVILGRAKILSITFLLDSSMIKPHLIKQLETRGSIFDLSGLKVFRYIKLSVMVFEQT